MSVPLVLLHGWGLSARVWAPLIEALPASLRIHAPDLPGHGAVAPAAVPTVCAWSEALLAGMPPVSIVCGWSLGGTIALDLANRHSDRVTRVILVDSSPSFVARPAGDHEPAWSHGLARATVESFMDGFAAEPSATQRRFVALQSLGDAHRRAVSNGLAAALTPPIGMCQRSLADGLRILADTDLRASVAAIEQPVLILHGANDALMPVAAASWLSTHLPASDLTIFDDCGHAPLLSRPAQCAALIEEWALD